MTIGSDGVAYYPWNHGDTLTAAALNDAISQCLTVTTDASIANVLAFGATGNGVSDDTSAIRAAIATGHNVYLPTGTYLVSNVLNLTMQNQSIYGDGIGRTVILVPATFPLSASGVFSMLANVPGSAASYSPGPAITDLDIVFAQVDTSVKANLIQFPPAIYISNTQRWRVERVKIVAGWNGIYAYANTTLGHAETSVGGGYVIDCQLACLNTSIYIDGALDTTRIRGCHIFPFGLTGNQISIFSNPSLTTGIAIYRADDFKIHGLLSLCGMGIVLNQSANGGPLGQISGCDFDTYSGIQAQFGIVTITGCTFIPSASGNTGLALISGPEITMAGCKFWVGSGSGGIVSVPPAGGNCVLVMAGCVISTDKQDVAAIAINTNSSPGNSLVMLSNVKFFRDVNTAYSNPAILCESNSATLMMANCQIDPKGTGTGTFVWITGINANNTMIGCSSVGWTNIGTVNGLAIADTSGPTITTGSAAPSSTQPIGSLYSRAGGAVGATLYVSRGGGSWAAVAGV